MKASDFDNQDLKILQDTDFLLSKRILISKIEELLKQCYIANRDFLQTLPFIPPEVFSKEGKISKGENYQNLPYFVLDFPRIFGENTFAIRVIVLWGRHIGIYFLASGKFLDLVDFGAFEHMQEEHDLYICTSDSPWHHLLESGEHYLTLPELGQSKIRIEEIVEVHGFLKVGERIVLKEIPDLEDRVLSFSKLLTLFLKKSINP